MVIIAVILFHVARDTHDPCYGTVIRLLHSIAITAFITQT